MTPTTTPTIGVVALRTIGAVLVELPFIPAAGTYTWAASIWPAADHPVGWGRQVWSYDPTRRGWIIPPSCTHGTVIELGAATTPRRRHPARTSPPGTASPSPTTTSGSYPPHLSTTRPPPNTTPPN
jgi:hypothetical protein